MAIHVGCFCISAFPVPSPNFPGSTLSTPQDSRFVTLLFWTAAESVRHTDFSGWSSSRLWIWLEMDGWTGIARMTPIWPMREMLIISSFPLLSRQDGRVQIYW